MIEKLFGSQTRAKLLKTFLLNPEKEYYIRQLARDFNLQLNSVRRELENLEKLGLLTSEPRRASDGDEEKTDEKRTQIGQEKRYFRVNGFFPLFEELKNLLSKSNVLYKQDLVDKLKETGDFALLVLTGFFVGDDNAETDILAIGNIDKVKFVKEIKKFEKETSREINFTVMTEKELEYRRSMTDVFLYAVLDGRKIVMINNNII